MNNSLAENILVQLMNWSQEQISEERPLIQALGKLKFDEYQQFSTGMRFTESLVNWLNEFETVDERNIAYQFIKSRLIFVTSNQVNHLINICFNERIVGILTVKAADLIKIPSYKIRKIHNHDIYKEVKRKSLFLGLSDGAKIDQLRRYAQLNNEQVFSSYYISDEKIADLLKELKDATDELAKFTSVFLIDDFTASGLSYLNVKEQKGKLLKFIDYVFEKRKDENSVILGDLIDNESGVLDIHIVFYIATRKSIRYLEEGIANLKAERGYRFQHSVNAVQIIEEATLEGVLSEKQFIDIIKQPKYFDNDIIDKHYEKGNIEKPYLGFDQCTLPVVLNHNTPNNSLPILWFPSDMSLTGLFPRVTRHKE